MAKAYFKGNYKTKKFKIRRKEENNVGRKVVFFFVENSYPQAQSLGRVMMSKK
ncbi:hypothetical protein [Metabacillus fastidiosus]|uniref:hypothetical protein n=1 Tax=Metabacillus fastidiosus TaxID=1458 RepID=UPI003D28044C